MSKNIGKRLQLRDERVQSTAIYTKLDLPALSLRGQCVCVSVNTI